MRLPLPKRKRNRKLTPSQQAHPRPASLDVKLSLACGHLHEACVHAQFILRKHQHLYPPDLPHLSPVEHKHSSNLAQQTRQSVCTQSGKSVCAQSKIQAQNMPALLCLASVLACSIDSTCRPYNYQLPERLQDELDVVQAVQDDAGQIALCPGR